MLALGLAPYRYETVTIAPFTFCMKLYSSKLYSSTHSRAATAHPAGFAIHHIDTYSVKPTVSAI